MNFLCRFKYKGVYFLHYLVFILFLFSIISKLLEFDLFISNLNQSPFFWQDSTTIIAIIILSMEILTTILLFFTKTKKIAYIFAFYIFLVYTGYITMMLLFSPYLPCSCGGLTYHLSWEQHIYLNMVFVIISGFLCFSNYENRKN